MSGTHPRNPSLPDLQGELRHHLAVLAVVLNDIYGSHALRAVLGATDATSDDDAIAGIEVTRSRIGALLPEAFDYAFHGRLDDTIAGELDDSPSYFDILGDFLAMLEHNDLADVVSADLRGGMPTVSGGLRRMVELARARHALDSGQALDARELAALAGMTERSVQNAFSLKGTQALHGQRVGGRFEVANVEARRWLHDRRAFVPTARVTIASGSERPARLDTGAEVRAYLRSVIATRFPTIEAAASRLGVSTASLESRLSGAHPIELPDACRYAQALGMDEAWFLLQVMQVNHPHETEVLKVALQHHS